MACPDISAVDILTATQQWTEPVRYGGDADWDVLEGGAYERNLTSTIERNVCGDDAAFLTLTTSYSAKKPSIGKTLWRVSTMFTRSAITPPEVSGFGWNLGSSEYIVRSWPWPILAANRAEARAGVLAEIYLSGKQLTTLPISGQPSFTKFAQKTWFW